MNTKVLLISDTVFDTNGVSRFIQDMAEQSRKANGAFSVLTASPLAGEHPEKNIINLKPFWCIRMPFYKEQFLTIVPPGLRMYRYVKAQRPDVMHISTPGPLGLCAMAVAKCQGIPVAGTYHTDFPSYIWNQTKSRPLKWMTRRFMMLFYHRLSRVFSRSRQYMGVLQQALGIVEDRLLFLPPGTDTERFSPGYRSETVWQDFAVPREGIKLLYVGRLSVEKNFMFVIELFEQLQEQSRVPLSLIVVGEGALADTVRRRGHRNIHLLGVQKGHALSQLYASSDLMLFASVTETLGQVVMEAQASGVPCIVSDRGGVTDIVADGETGYCLDVEDKMQWLRKAKQLIEEDGIRKRMGAAGSIRMQARSIEQTYVRFMQAHHELIKSESNNTRENVVEGSKNVDSLRLL